MKKSNRGLTKVVAISELLESVSATEIADMYDMGLVEYDGTCSDLLWDEVDGMTDEQLTDWLLSIVRRG